MNTDNKKDFNERLGEKKKNLNSYNALCIFLRKHSMK